MADINSQITTILEQNRYPDSGLTPAGQAAYIKRYSAGALVLNFFYYFSMGDTLFAWLSVGASVFFIFLPLLVVLPLFARRRAYSARNWSSFNEFYAVQKRWDRWGLYLLAVTVVLIILILWTVGPTILRATQSLTGNSDGDYIQQLQQTEQQYRDLLGE